MSKDLTLLDLWYEALASPLGIVLETDDPQRLRIKLYEARKAACDTDLEQLSVVISPFIPDQVWLVKNGKAKIDSTPSEGDS